MSRRTKTQMIELSAKVVSLCQANPTLSDAAIARHFDTSPATVAAILRKPHRVEPADSLDDQSRQADPNADEFECFKCHNIFDIEESIAVAGGFLCPACVPGGIDPSWVMKHSVNCYFCGTLFDEREGMPADELNGNDGGTACPKCYKFRHKEDDVDQDTEDFTAHIVLYAKGHYGHSGDIIEDLKTLLCEYAGLDRASTSDVWQLLCEAFSRYVTKEFDIAEGLMEMLGKKRIGFNERLNRKPEEIIIGKLSVIDGCHCHTSIKLNIKFEPKTQGV